MTVKNNHFTLSSSFSLILRISSDLTFSYQIEVSLNRNRNALEVLVDLNDSSCSCSLRVGKWLSANNLRVFLERTCMSLTRSERVGRETNHQTKEVGQK